MIEATYKDKPLVVRILCDAFDSNRSINYIVKQDSKRSARIKTLMEYSFDICYKCGRILLSEDREACALLLFPDKRKFTISSIYADLLFVARVSGIFSLRKIFNREKKIKANYPPDPILYLWFIGVSKASQGRGIGTRLLKDIVDISIQSKKPIYLETSMPKNIDFYTKVGFDVYNELDFSYKLYLLRRR